MLDDTAIAAHSDRRTLRDHVAAMLLKDYVFDPAYSHCPSKRQHKEWMQSSSFPVWESIAEESTRGAYLPPPRSDSALSTYKVAKPVAKGVGATAAAKEDDEDDEDSDDDEEDDDDDESDPDESDAGTDDSDSDDDDSDDEDDDKAE